MMKITRAFLLRFSVELLILLVALLAIGSARLNLPEPEIKTIVVTPTPIPMMPANRIVYVQYSDDNSTSDLWVVDLAQPNQPRQLSFNEQGKTIHDYQVTRYGETIVYSVYNRNSPIYDNLMRLDVATGEIMPVTDCAYQGVWCQRFALSASGEYMMYHYKSGTWYNEMRVVDLRSQPFTQYAVYRFNGADSNFPQPIAVGRTNTFAFAVGDNNHQLYDADTKMLGDTLVTSSNGYPLFSLDGSKYATTYISETSTTPQFQVYQTTPNVALMQYQNSEFDSIPSGQFADAYVDWHPNNMTLLVKEPNMPDCSTVGFDDYDYSYGQFYSTRAGVATLPIIGGALSHASWDATGTKIVVNTPLDTCNSTRYELTIYNTQSRTKMTLPIDARQPQWLGR